MKNVNSESSANVRKKYFPKSKVKLMAVLVEKELKSLKMPHCYKSKVKLINAALVRKEKFKKIPKR